MHHTEHVKGGVVVEVSEEGVLGLRWQLILDSMDEIGEGDEVLEGMNVPVDDFLLHRLRVHNYMIHSSYQSTIHDFNQSIRSKQLRLINHV